MTEPIGKGIYPKAVWRRRDKHRRPYAVACGRMTRWTNTKCNLYSVRGPDAD
jgi:hypothetical protein